MYCVSAPRLFLSCFVVNKTAAAVMVVTTATDLELICLPHDPLGENLFPEMSCIQWSAVFNKIQRHLKILCARRVTRSKIAY